MPGTAELLKQLAGRGLSLGIVSNAQFYTPLLFEALLGSPPGELGFTESLCVWSYEIRRGKPSLDLFQIAQKRLAQLGIGPDETVFVGNDMLNDITPPRCLGWKTILFAGDMRSLRLREEDERCADTQPDAAVTDLMQIAHLLSR